MTLSPLILRKIAEAKASAGGDVFNDGRYLLVLRDLEIDAKFKGVMFIARFDVLRAERMLDDVEPNKAGSVVGVAMNLDTNVSAPGNVKALFLALLGKKEADYPGEEFARDVERYTAAAQPARGMLIAMSTYRKPIRSGPNAGKPFVGQNWTHVPQTPADVASRRLVIETTPVAPAAGSAAAAASAAGSAAGAASAAGSAAPAATPVPLDDLDMDGRYLLRGLPVTFAGKSRGEYHFVHGDGRREKIPAASVGPVYLP